MITLAQAVPLRKSIERRIAELDRELNENSTVSIKKGEEWDKPDRTVEMIDTEIRAAETDYLKLDALVTAANQANTIEWDGQEICLSSAIELAKQLRIRSNRYKNLGARKKTQRGGGHYMYDSSPDLITVTTYEPSDYREPGLKLGRQADLLSSMIERQNHFVELDFDASNYLG